MQVGASAQYTPDGVVKQAGILVTNFTKPANTADLIVWDGSAWVDKPGVSYDPNGGAANSFKTV